MNASSVFLAFLYSTASAAVLIYLFNSSARNKRLVIPVSLNLAAAVVILVLTLRHPSPLFSISPFGVGQTELFITLLLALVFALFVEVPGFVLNLAYDKKKEDALRDIVEILLEVRLSPSAGNRTRLRDSAQSHQAILEEHQLGKIILKCAGEFIVLGNSDSSLLNTLTEQVLKEQAKVSERSKHPFPVLIQLLSLTGVAFVLGEILAVLRQK